MKLKKKKKKTNCNYFNSWMYILEDFRRLLKKDVYFSSLEICYLFMEIKIKKAFLPKNLSEK